MKFVDVSYGTQGKGELYTYAVNDSVRVGDILQVSVKHYRNGKIFGTTAVTQSTAKETSAKGQEMKQNAQENSRNGEIATAQTARELGIQRTRLQSGQYGYEGAGAGRGVKNEEGRYQAEEGKPFVRTSRIQQVRGANILSRQQQTGGEISSTRNTQEAVETFDSYSKQFMPKGDR